MSGEFVAGADFDETVDTVLGSNGFRDKNQLGVEGLLMTKNSESNVEQLAHDGAPNGEVMELTSFEKDDPGLEGSAPAPSDRGGHIEGFAQEAIADFAKMGLAIAAASGTPFCRS